MSRIRAWQHRILLSTWTVPVTVASFWMLLIVVIHRNSPRTLVSFHGLLHAAIAGQFLAPVGNLWSLENPFYAAAPLPYYWFFHFLAAQITRFFGLNIFYSFELLVVVATGVLMITALSLGVRLNRSRISGVLIGFLIMAGTNPLGWLFALKALVRDGRSVLNDNPDYLWGVVHPIYSLIRYNDFGGIYGPLLNFFLNITSRPLALAGLLGMVFFLLALLQRCRMAPIIGLAVSSAATTLFSPLIGITAGGAMMAGLAFFCWKNRDDAFTHRITPIKSALYAAMAIASGIIAALPTYYQLLLNSGGGGAQFILFSMPGLRQLLGLSLSISVLFGLAVLGVYRARRENRRFLTTLVVSALPLLVMNAAFVLTAGNESNLFHAAVVFLAVPASASVVRRHPLNGKSLVRKGLMFAIFILFLPTTLLLIASYINRPALPVSFGSAEIMRTPEDSELGRLYAWVKNDTNPRAVFIIDPRKRTTVCGNTAEFPAFTGRSMFTEDLDHYLTKPNADAPRRFEMAVRLVSGERPQESDKEYLGKLGRPIYILNDQEPEPALINRMQESYGPPVFHVGSVSVYEFPSNVPRNLGRVFLQKF